MLLAAGGLALYLFVFLFSLPSSLSPKVDFRTQGDIHVDSLIWASLNVFPVAPLLAVVAVLVQLGAVVWAGCQRMRNG
jgi:hypothetical protein